MFDPYARADEGQGDARPGAGVRYLNINKKVTAVAAGALGAEGADGRDIRVRRHGDGCPGVRRDEQHGRVFRGTRPNTARLRAPDAVSKARTRVSRARASSDEPSEDPLLLVGGNCSLQGLDASGEEAFWTVASDVVAALGVFADGKIAVGTEDGGARVCAVAADGSERVAFEVKEADAVTHLVPATEKAPERYSIASDLRENETDTNLFAFASRDGAVGARDAATCLWREKRGVSKRATCAVAFDLTGDGSIEIVFGFADGTMEASAFPNRGAPVRRRVRRAARRRRRREGETRRREKQPRVLEVASGDLLACAVGRRGARVPRQGQAARARSRRRPGSRPRTTPRGKAPAPLSVTASGRAYDSTASTPTEREASAWRRRRRRNPV